MREVLKPLQDSSRTDYLYQYQKLSDFSQRMNNLESLYAEIYTQITALERQTSKIKEAFAKASNTN